MPYAWSVIQAAQPVPLVLAGPFTAADETAGARATAYDATVAALATQRAGVARPGGVTIRTVVP